MSQTSNTKRIAKNTLMLYFRQILIMLVSLYTVRVVLNVLGAEDYGIYNVVAGVVTMFSFLSGAMATASQRYFSFDLGKNDTEHLKITFSITFQIYVLLAFLVVLLAETLGVWFVNHKLVIPPERMSAANWIFQAAIVSFLLTLITTPYMACIIAHENMNVYAYVSIVESVLKLGIVVLLRVIPADKLIVYGILLAIVAFINTSIYRMYCHLHYEECKIRFVKNNALFKEIISYSAWNLFGTLAGVFKSQITNILLNLYFGTVVNAARAVAAQVNGAVSSFAQNFTTAIRPPIIKTFAARERKNAFILACRGSKYTFFLLYMIALPLLLEMNIVLNIWLKQPPADAVLFTRLVIIETVMVSVSYSIMALCQATGKIKLYQGIVGGILLLNLPVSYFALKQGSPAYFVMIIAIIIEILAFFARIIIIKKLTYFSITVFFLKCLLPCILVAVLASIIPIYIFNIMPDNVFRLFIIIITSIICMVIFIFLVGMTKEERKSAIEKINKKIKHNE